MDTASWISFSDEFFIPNEFLQEYKVLIYDHLLLHDITSSQSLQAAMAWAMGATARVGDSEPTCSLNFLTCGSLGSM